MAQAISILQPAGRAKLALASNTCFTCTTPYSFATGVADTQDMKP